VGIVFKNNAKTTLASSLSNSATSATVTDGSVFPSLNAGEFFLITFDDGSNNEICKCTARSSNTLTIVRAQESTTARAFSSGDAAEGRVTAGVLEQIQENIASKSANQTIFNATTAGGATTYNIGTNPGVEANAMVFLNGVLQHHDTLSFSGTNLTFDAAPPNGMALEVIIDNLINLQSSNLTVDTFTAADITGNNTQTDFVLSDTPAAETNLIVFVDGVFQDQDSYTISSNTLTITDEVIAGRGVTVYVINPVNIGTPSDSTVTSAKLSGNITMPGTLTVGSNDVAFDSPTFVVDNANSRVGLGTASPSVPVDIVGDVKMSADLTVDTTTLVVDSSNNRVGIGTASPSDYWSTANGLVVRESDNSTGITIATGTSNTGQLYFADGTSGDARYRGWLNYAHGTDTMSLATAASAKVTILSSGNVGIGTSSPEGVLHVHGGDSGSSYSADGADRLIIENNDSVAIDLRTPASNQALIMFSDGTRSQGLIGYSHSADSLRFANSGNQTRMFIKSDGRVGIGTTDPDGILHVKPASGDTYVILEAGQSDGNTGLIYHNNSGTQVGYNLYDTDDNIYYIGVGGINRVTIRNGNHFELRGPDANSNQVKMMDSSGNIDGYLYAEASEIGFLDADGNWALQVKTDTHIQGKINNSEAFLFKIAAGNHNSHEVMSIGGITPRNDITLTQQAHGENWGSGGHTTNGYFYVVNSSNSGVYIVNGQNSWTGNSDERIKENITSLGTVLPEIKDIRCVKFNLKGDSQTRVGFIAQDWESKSFKEVLNENDGFVVEEDGSVKPAADSDSTEKVKGIAYTETVPVLLKAIQEQQTIIDDLKARIETLEG